VLPVPLGGPGESGVGSGLCFVEEVNEAVTIPVAQDGHVPLLDDRAGLLDEGADGEVADRLPEGCSSFFDDCLEVVREPEVEPGIPGSCCHG
jgi:hypothetical protein